MDLPVPVFELKHVSQQFSQFSALTDINLQIYPGERVALVGSSGAGKSTLLQLLNGTLRSTQGEVWAMGRNLSQLNPKRLRQIQQQIGTIYQQLNLVDNLRVIHNVNAGHLGRWSFLKALTSLIVPLETETAIKALSQVGIAEKLYERTDRLSGGQQQRVAIARVLVQNPIVILADEPIASLDPELSREVMDLLRNLAQQTHRTLIVSLHDVDFARSHCDRIIGLRQGKILFDAAPHQVSPDLITDLYRLESHR
jgi:phosphonate transport system ATP-binding protein